MKPTIGLLLVAIAALSGCGPIESVAVINDAEVSISGAKAADGAKYAPYEYTSAELYLDKAKEERGHAQYQKAIDYARQAREMARQAEAKSMKKAQQNGSDASQGGLVPFQDDGTKTEKVKEVAPAP